MPIRIKVKKKKKRKVNEFSYSDTNEVCTAGIIQ